MIVAQWHRPFVAARGRTWPYLAAPDGGLVLNGRGRGMGASR